MARPPGLRAAAAGLALGAPAGLALLLAAANGLIAPAAALGVWLAGVAGAWLLAWGHLRRQGETARLLRRLAGSEAGGEALPEAATRAARRFDELTRRVAALEAAMPALLDGLAVPVLTIDGRRRITHANRAAREMAGRDPAGLDLAEALRDPAALEAADAVLAGAASRSVEFQLAAPSPRDLNARIVRLPQPAADGALAALTFEDFTEMRRIEKMRADFVANASHEIRTPLATLAGCVETLQGAARDDPAAQERFLAIMQQQAERMTRLVGDLLSLSRIELNEHSAPTGRVHLPPLLARVVEGLAPKAAEARVRIALDAAPDLPPAIGDENELWQVFQNLIDNAIKYGGEGNPVEVTCEAAEGAALRVTVRDRGPGIAREHLPRLTERFYRVDTARSRRLGGTGLGLAIVKHIVNRHRGALTIESTPGQGSAFSVRLPAQIE